MLNIQEIFAIFIIIGVCQHHVVIGGPVKNEIQGLIVAAISDTEQIAKQLEGESQEHANALKKATDELQETVNKYLLKARVKLDNGSGILEKDIEKLLHFKLSDEICGVLSFRRSALDVFDIGRTCSMQVLDTALQNMRDLIKQSFQISTEIVKVVENIEQCGKCQGHDLQEVRNCIQTNKNKAKDLTKEIVSINLQVRNFQKIGQIVLSVKLCLAGESFKKIIHRAESLTTCLKGKFPDLINAAKKIKRASQYLTDEIKNGIKVFQKEFERFPEKVKVTLKKAYNVAEKEVESTWSIIKKTFEDFGRKIKNFFG